MKYWIDWLLRESMAVVAINVLTLIVALLSGRLGAHLEPTIAVFAGTSVLVALTLLNVASARRHAEPGRRLYWLGFAIYESIAVAATWATWSLRAVA